MTDTHNDHRHRTTTCPPGDTGLLNFVYITTPVTTVTDTHLASSSLSTEGRLCSVLDNICQGHKCWQSDHIEHEREATIVSKAWLGDAWLTLGPICLHLPLLRKPLRSLHSSLLSAGSRQHLPRSGSTLPRLVSPLGCCSGLQSSPAYLTSEQDCQFLMDNDPNNDLDLWRTQIFITMQCLPRILDGWYFEVRNFLSLRKKFQSNDEVKSVHLLSGIVQVIDS